MCECEESCGCKESCESDEDKICEDDGDETWDEDDWSNVAGILSAGTVGAGASATRYVFYASVNVFHAVGMACEGAGDPFDVILATVEETELHWLDDVVLATVEETGLPWLDEGDACVDPRESCELLDEIGEGVAVFQTVDGGSVFSVSCSVFPLGYSVTVIFPINVIVASAT